MEEINYYLLNDFYRNLRDLPSNDLKELGGVVLLDVEGVGLLVGEVEGDLRLRGVDEVAFLEGEEGQEEAVFVEEDGVLIEASDSNIWDENDVIF